MKKIKELYVIVKIFNNEKKLTEHNGNRYTTLALALRGNLCPQDRIKNMRLDSKQEEDGETVYYYLINLL